MRARIARRTPPHRQRGKALIWAIGLLAALAAAWWYFLPQMLPAALRSALPHSPNARADVYKWRDAKGRLQLTSTPPADRPYETLHYDPNLNVVPGANPSTPAQP